MAAESQPKGRDVVLSSLNVAIDGLDLAKELPNSDISQNGVKVREDVDDKDQGVSGICTFGAL